MATPNQRLQLSSPEYKRSMQHFAHAVAAHFLQNPHYTSTGLKTLPLHSKQKRQGLISLVLISAWQPEGVQATGPGREVQDAVRDCGRAK
jgi:hypothetical protein